MDGFAFSAKKSEAPTNVLKLCHKRFKSSNANSMPSVSLHIYSFQDTINGFFVFGETMERQLKAMRDG